MDILIALIFLVSVVGLIVGLIKPKWALRWEKDEEKWNRKNVLKYFLTATVVSFLLVGVFADDSEDLGEPEETVGADQEIEEEVEEEPEFEELSSEERELFNKSVDELSELSYDELDNMILIIGNKDEYIEEDKELIDKHTTEIEEIYTVKLEEKEEKEAQEKAEREAKEEEERKKKEEEEKKRKEEEAKAEAEKYETGITFEDIARDKDGLFGEYVKFSGTVVQVMQGDGYMQYRLATSGNYDNVILIEVDESLLEQNILEDDNIAIEGMSMGNMTYETVMGAEREIPAVLVENLYH